MGPVLTTMEHDWHLPRIPEMTRSPLAPCAFVIRLSFEFPHRLHLSPGVFSFLSLPFIPCVLVLVLGCIPIAKRSDLEVSAWPPQ